MRAPHFFSLLVIALVLATATGCSVPDYQLQFDVQVTSSSPSYSTVSYSLTNTGSKEVYNATVDIGLRDSIGGPTIGSASTKGVDIGAGETASGTIAIGYYPYSYSGAFPEAFIISSGWDSDKNSSVF